MRWSYKVARVSGIDVKIHVTFLLILGWFGLISWREGGWWGAVEGVSFTLLLFLCVLLHEFGHAFAARAFGIRTPDITLLPIGGVARLERMPEKPIQELIVAVAGPAVNVVIALFLFVFLAAKFTLRDIVSFGSGGFLTSLLAVNIMLVAFNAIPAFPMDGGRVLRALLSMMIPPAKATMIAARIGQVVAVGFAIASFNGWSPMLLFIAIFVFGAAQQELRYAQFQATGAAPGNPSRQPARCVGDIMQTGFTALPSDTLVATALTTINGSTQGIFPIIDRQLRAVGVVSARKLELAVSGGLGTRMVDSMADPVARIQADAPITAAMAAMPTRVPVVVENRAGEMVGMLLA